MINGEPVASELDGGQPHDSATVRKPSTKTSMRTSVARGFRVIGWPFRTLLIWLIAGYQRFISPVLPSSCRYYPCCSAYARKAINRHGAAKGTVLVIWRILRCNPWSGGGLDPVPRRRHWVSHVHPDGAKRSNGGSPDRRN